jgi:AmmeMemoRadiSam system protein B
MAMKRPAAVAGTFYPSSGRELRRMIEGFIPEETEKWRAKTVVVPHAGYIYSGAVAGATFASVEIPESVLILGPSHRPIRSLFAVMEEGVWETPLGPVPVEPRLAAAILRSSPGTAADPGAHAGEHSLEVQVPFLQVLKPSVSIVPIAISHRAGFEELSRLGEAAASAIRSLGAETLIVASTDMSHFISRAEARKKDFLAIERILDLNPRGLFDVVVEEDISMCGFQPVTAALVASLALGASRSELVAYATSADRTGDDREVVGYAGLRIV